MDKKIMENMQAIMATAQGIYHKETLPHSMLNG